jgi:hypothetical protein
MSRRLNVTAAAACLTASAFVVGLPSAGAATDRTPPKLTLPAVATFVVGSQLSDSPADPDSTYVGSSMTQKVGWGATDAGSGVCGYDVYAVYAGDDPALVVSDSPATSYTFTATDYDDQEGGGSFKVLGYDVVARDCAGNTTRKFVQSRPVVTQEDGWTYVYPGVTVSYTAAWSTSSCTCWSADGSRKTTAKGAAATISKHFVAGESLALVMEKAPTRGVFVVYVDGKKKGKVDTYSAATQHRTVVWATRMPAGLHEVKIVNKATKGRARIDLDAVLTGTESVGP